MITIQFNGVDFDPELIAAVSDIESIQTGTMACDWTYGFYVYVGGSKIEMRYPLPTNIGCLNGPTREDFRSMVKKDRDVFVQMWKEHGVDDEAE